jgi:hypothetical protein
MAEAITNQLIEARKYQKMSQASTCVLKNIVYNALVKYWTDKIAFVLVREDVETVFREQHPEIAMPSDNDLIYILDKTFDNDYAQECLFNILEEEINCYIEKGE